MKFLALLTLSLLMNSSFATVDDPTFREGAVIIVNTEDQCKELYDATFCEGIVIHAQASNVLIDPTFEEGAVVIISHEDSCEELDDPTFCNGLMIVEDNEVKDPTFEGGAVVIKN